MRMNIWNFRDFIASLIDSKTEGFDLWQEKFSKVLEPLCVF
jgi:hypothetical protein